MKKSIVFLLLFFVLTIPFYAQNVGIGTESPSEKLEVDGNLKADTLKPNALLLAPNAGSGKILTSDELGNATWENNSYAPPPEDNIGYGVWGDCATNGNISAYHPVADEEGTVDDYFGNSVSMSGNFAMVGAFRDDGVSGENQGSVSFYQFDGNAWVFMEKIVDTDGAANDLFGKSVAISGNYAIIGSYLDDGDVGANQGSISFYQFDGLNWVLMEKITDVDGAASDFFGFSVSLADDYAIVGSINDDGPAGVDQGSVTIYHFDGTSWTLVEKIFDADGNSNDSWGYSISITANYFIVGSRFDDAAAGSNQGSASIYEFDGSNWAFMQKLIDATGDVDDYFGSSVAISGNYAMVGSPNDNVGSNTDQGSVSFYQLVGNNWMLMQKLTDKNGEANDLFGQSESISGNYAIVGSGNDNVPPYTDQGAAHIFVRLGNTWQKLQYVIDPAGDGSDYFGGASAIDASTKHFLLGAAGYEVNMGKVVFGKIN